MRKLTEELTFSSTVIERKSSCQLLRDCRIFSRERNVSLSPSYLHCLLTLICKRLLFKIYSKFRFINLHYEILNQQAVKCQVFNMSRYVYITSRKSFLDVKTWGVDMLCTQQPPGRRSRRHAEYFYGVTGLASASLFIKYQDFSFKESLT